MLNEQELRILCRRLKLPKAGGESLAHIRARLDQPVAFSRAPLMLAEPDERGLYPSAKMGRRFPFLLGTDQLAVLDHLEHDDEVLEYYPWPAPIIIAATNQSEPHINEIRYPQFFVIRVHAVGWEDWRTTGEKQENVMPALRFSYWEKYVTDIHPERRRMLRFLETWLGETRPRPDAQIASALLEYIASHPGIMLGTLCKEITAASMNDVYPLIAMGQISVELGMGSLEDPEHIACFQYRDQNGSIFNLRESRALPLPMCWLLACERQASLILRSLTNCASIRLLRTTSGFRRPQCTASSAWVVKRRCRS